jgi:hypothetical protein
VLHPGLLIPCSLTLTLTLTLTTLCGGGRAQRVTDEFITLQQRDLGKTEGGNIDTLAHVTHLEHGKVSCCSTRDIHIDTTHPHADTPTPPCPPHRRRASTTAQAERHTLEKALKADTVLGPILDHLRCIITRGGMPGEECCYGQPDASC